MKFLLTRVRVVVFNATLHNISDILWQSVLLDACYNYLRSDLLSNLVSKSLGAVIVHNIYHDISKEMTYWSQIYEVLRYSRKRLSEIKLTRFNFISTVAYVLFVNFNKLQPFEARYWLLVKRFTTTFSAISAYYH
jgi:hypothetical protein